MMMTTILNKSVCVTRQGLGLKTYLSVVSSLTGRQEETIGAQCCLEASISPRASPALWGCGSFLLLVGGGNCTPPLRAPRTNSCLQAGLLSLGTSQRGIFLQGDILGGLSL